MKINERRIDEATKIFTDLLQYRIILKNHSKIANAPLPKSKAKKHEQLLADWIVKVRNTENQLNGLVEDFNKDEALIYSAKCREILGGDH